MCGAGRTEGVEPSLRRKGCAENGWVRPGREEVEVDGAPRC